MDGLFAGAEFVWVVLPSAAAAGDGLRDLAELLVQESYELEVELGAPVGITGNRKAGRPRLVLSIAPDLGAPTLVHDREERQLTASGADLDGLVDALNLIRTLRTRDLDTVAAAAVRTVPEAIDVVQHEVATTYPGFELRALDWERLGRRHRPHVDDQDPLPGLERWVAALGDAHTHVLPVPRPVALPYTAALVDGRLRLGEVPPGTPAAEAGARTGDEILGVDIDDLWSRTGAPAHLRPWVVGRRALSCPPGGQLTIHVVRNDGTTTEWTESPSPDPWPQPIETRRLASGTGCLRIRRWTTDDEDHLDTALEELGGTARLIVDLRGNTGGQLVAATAFRDRFVPRPLRLGSIRFSTGDGTLSPPATIDGRPSDRRRWGRPVRILTDALTYSASEDAILGLQQLPGVAVVGLPSGGGSGRARTLRLLDGMALSVSTALTYDHMGRCVEDRGIAVDHRLPDTFGDTALEAADRTW